MFKVGDVVSVELPFSDLYTRKRRPGVVLVSGDADVLLARITTHPPRDNSDVPLEHWSETGLPRASTARLTKLATVDCRLVHHRIGRLHLEDARVVARAWQEMAATLAAEIVK